MTQLVVVALTITTAFAMSAAAVAQYSLPAITGVLKVTPARAGTPAKPKNGFLGFAFDVAPATLSRVELTIPAGVSLTTKGFPTCSVERLQVVGDSACPPRSLVGTGVVKGAEIDSLEVFVDGPGALALYPVSRTFAPVRARLAGRKLAFDVPAQARLDGMIVALGRQTSVPAFTTTGKGAARTTRFFASVVGCARAKQTGSVKAFLAPEATTFLTTGAISSSCKAAPKQ